jgi:hypothetical protein
MNIRGMSDDVETASRESDIMVAEGTMKVALISRIIMRLNCIAARARPLRAYLSDNITDNDAITITTTNNMIPNPAIPAIDNTSNPLDANAASCA